jgi:hypothetical protein
MNAAGGTCDPQILHAPFDLSAVRSRTDRRMVAYERCNGKSLDAARFDEAPGENALPTFA